MTSRVGLGYGLDGTIRPVGDEYLTFELVRTFQDEAPNRPYSVGPARMQIL